MFIYYISFCFLIIWCPSHIIYIFLSEKLELSNIERLQPLFLLSPLLWLPTCLGYFAYIYLDALTDDAMATLLVCTLPLRAACHPLLYVWGVSIGTRRQQKIDKVKQWLGAQHFVNH